MKTLVKQFILGVSIVGWLASPTLAQDLHFDFSDTRISQGGTLRLLVRSGTPITESAVKFGKRKVRLYAVQNQSGPPYRYRVFIGIPRSLKPGNYPLKSWIVFKDGTTNTNRQLIRVVDGRFPTQAIRLKPKKQKLFKNKKQLSTESKVIGRTFRQSSEQLWFKKPFVQPVQGRITSKFGAHRTYNGKPGWKHAGVDIAAPEGTEIVAPNTGIVTLSQSFPNHGNTVMVDHGQGIVSIYTHLQKRLVRKHDKVRTGQAIGLMGQTGIATGSHLHWGMSVHNTRVNPMEWLTNMALYDI